jgi:hypothetical protein
VIGDEVTLDVGAVAPGGHCVARTDVQSDWVSVAAARRNLADLPGSRWSGRRWSGSAFDAFPMTRHVDLVAG